MSLNVHERKDQVTYRFLSRPFPEQCIFQTNILVKSRNISPSLGIGGLPTNGDDNLLMSLLKTGILSGNQHTSITVSTPLLENKSSEYTFMFYSLRATAY